jgi:hypothetical protein
MYPYYVHVSSMFCILPQGFLVCSFHFRFLNSNRPGGEYNPPISPTIRVEQPKVKRPGSIMSDFLIVESDGSIQVPSRSASPLGSDTSLEDGFVVFESEEGTRFVFDGMEVSEYKFDSEMTDDVTIDPTLALTFPEHSLAPSAGVDPDIEDFGDVSDELLEEFMELFASSPVASVELSTERVVETSSSQPENPTTTPQTIPLLSPEFRQFLFTLSSRNHHVMRPHALGGLRGFGTTPIGYPFSYHFVRQMRPSQTAGEVDNSYYVPIQDDFGIEEIMLDQPTSAPTDHPSLFFVKRKCNSPSREPLVF